MVVGLLVGIAGLLVLTWQWYGGGPVLRFGFAVAYLLGMACLLERQGWALPWRWGVAMPAATIVLVGLQRW